MTCSFRATSELFIPCPQLSTIRARIAMACADFGRRGVAQAATGDLGNLTQHLYCRESRVYDPRPKAVKEADLKRSLFDGDRHINAGTSLVRALVS